MAVRAGILAVALALGVAGIPGFGPGGEAAAQAQNPFAAALTVNDSAVTFYDIEQRQRLLEALGARGDVRALAIEQLTEDRVKVQAARAAEIELPEGAVLAGTEEFAAQRGLTVDDVFEVLANRNIDRQTMDDFVEAGLLWRDVVQMRFAARATPSEEELDLAVELAATAPVETVDMSEIALPFAERGEPETVALAERLSRELSRGGDFAAAARQYSRSGSAARGGRLEPVPASRLPPAIRTQVLLLSAGGVTRPIPISGGVAILKLNAIREEPPGAGGAPEETDEELRNRLRQEIFTQRITSFGQGYLQELVADALIIER